MRLVGHTNGIGGAEFNLKLSQTRAQAVIADLAGSYGIVQARLGSEDKGMSAPLAPNDTEEGHAKNRRVELVAMK